MRLNSFRAPVLGALALVLWSCTDAGITDPTLTAPAGPRRALTGNAGIVINEIMPNPAAVADEVGEWFEVFNAGDTDVNLQGWKIASANDAVHTISSSVPVPAGGYVVLARNGNTTVNGGVSAAYVYTVGTVTLNLNNSNTDWLALRDPSGVSVDSVHWGTSSPPTGASRGVVNPLLDNTLMSGTGANWATQTTAYNSVDKGTPGAQNNGAIPPPPPPPPVGALVINEILADPSAVLDADGEWFEVHNPGAAPVDVQGWTIASNNDAPHTIASSVVIPAGGYAVFGRNDDPGSNGGVTLAYSYATATTLNLSNTSDYLALRNASGATVDSVAYAVAPPRGASRALTSPTSDNTDVAGSGWFNSTTIFGAGDRGTPGAANNSVPPGEPGVPAAISISINFPQRVPVGYTKPAFATVRDGTGAVMSPPPALAWSSSNPAVATVDSLGYITGVSVGTTTIRATAPNGVVGQANFSVIDADATTPAIYRNHVEFGAPAGGPAGVLLNKRQFVTSYNPGRGGPNWVAWNLNGTQFGAAPRCDCFSADQTLPADVYHVVDFDYRNGGYDRGHMVQSESRTTTDQENASTFLLTNILPQAANNNQGPWAQLEIALNDMVRTGGKEVYVIAGGIYAASPATLKNEGKVAIPDYTWKVAVVVDAGEGLADVHSAADLQVIAVKMPNLLTTAAAIRNTPWQNFAVTVDQLAAETGYDLLASLPNQIEILVEANDRAPVAATDGPYNGLEGSAVTLDGSASSDPDGDALTYAWNFGDGTTGTGAKPTHTYADNGNYVVTLTVTDPAGAESTTTTSVTVFNVAPAVAAFPGASILAHQGYAATGSFGDPGADSWTATVDYGDGSGAQPLALDGNGFSLSHTYHAAGTYTVTVTVTDDEGAPGTRTATVVVTNVAPAVAAFAGATILPGETYSSAGSFADPGPDTWTATVDYGDGSGAQPLALDGKSFSLSHAYAAAGTYTVTVTVTDDGGLSGSRTATVTVLSAQQGIRELMSQVSALGPTLGSGNVVALTAILRNATASLNRGDTGAAMNQLQAFINQVEAYVLAGDLTPAQGEALTGYARRIVASLGG